MIFHDYNRLVILPESSIEAAAAAADVSRCLARCYRVASMVDYNMNGSGTSRKYYVNATRGK